jgi:hypothetical protein
MGVYHFMGLGRSVGAVTAAISYLAARYRRWNAEDRVFFALSGETQQSSEKRGDVQALVLFTTREIRQERETCQPYVLNQPGQTRGPTRPGETVPQALKWLLPGDLELLAGGRPSIRMYWCDYARERPDQTFERVAEVLMAAKPPGKLGKEVWVNLTGGTNIINSALELAAELSGISVRFYYLLSDDIRCARHTVRTSNIGTSRDTFWVDLPTIYLGFDAAHRAILTVLARSLAEVPIPALYSMVKQEYYHVFEAVAGEALFRRLYLVPLRVQRLILWHVDDTVEIGPGWGLLRRYYDAIHRPVNDVEHITLEQLADARDWLHVEELKVRR